jgi:hypothetical protein
MLSIVLFGSAPPDLPRNATGRSNKVDFTTNTMMCMQVMQLVFGSCCIFIVGQRILLPQKAYDARNLTGMLGMFQCWSSATAMDNFPKSSDFAGAN